MKVKKLIKKVSNKTMIGFYNPLDEFCGNFTTDNVPLMLYERRIKYIWTGVVKVNDHEQPKINITLKGE